MSTATLLGAFLLAAVATPAFAQLEIVVPAYFYPGNNSPWGAMTAALADVEVTAIMNPNNGPGSAVDSNYTNVVNAHRAAGGRVIGYVYSSYGARPIADVLADIDKFAQWYAIDGIFVDEMRNSGPAVYLDYYKTLYDHVKGINPAWEVMGNPGTTTIEHYLTWPAADRLMVQENVGALYSGYAPSPWNDKYDRSHFVHLVHSEIRANLESDLLLAQAYNAGAIYVTDDVLNNPWDTLPSFWTTEVQAVAALNAALADADFTSNGQVDDDDLARWENGFGAILSGGLRRNGDADANGAVDGNDFLIWQSAVADGMLTGPNAATVPEPCASLLAISGCFCWRWGLALRRSHD